MCLEWHWLQCVFEEKWMQQVKSIWTFVEHQKIHMTFSLFKRASPSASAHKAQNNSWNWINCTQNLLVFGHSRRWIFSRSGLRLLTIYLRRCTQRQRLRTGMKRKWIAPGDLGWGNLWWSRHLFCVRSITAVNQYWKMTYQTCTLSRRLPKVNSNLSQTSTSFTFSPGNRWNWGQWTIFASRPNIVSEPPSRHTTP